MYVCIYIYIYMHAHAYAHIHIEVNMYLCMYLCIDERCKYCKPWLRYSLGHLPGRSLLCRSALALLVYTNVAGTGVITCRSPDE